VRLSPVCFVTGASQGIGAAVATCGANGSDAGVALPLGGDGSPA